MYKLEQIVCNARFIMSKDEFNKFVKEQDLVVFYYEDRSRASGHVDSIFQYAIYENMIICGAEWECR